MSSPARAKKAASGISATASPSRAFSKTSPTFATSPMSPSRSFKKSNDYESPKDTRRSLQGGMKSGSYSPAASPARDFKSKNESSMNSPSKLRKVYSSPASSPSRAYNVCPSPMHPSTYQTYPSPMASPMNLNIRPSRLAGRHSSLPSSNCL